MEKSQSSPQIKGYLKIILYLEYICGLCVLSVCVLYVIKPYLCRDIRYLNTASFENLQDSSNKINVLKEYCY